MSQHKPSYLRAYRLRAGLSQKEMGALFGRPTGVKVCNYECHKRYPSLETALSYQYIFDVPVHKLFPELYSELKGSIQKQAQTLLQSLSDDPADVRSSFKKTLLNRLAMSSPYMNHEERK